MIKLFAILLMLFSFVPVTLAAAQQPAKTAPAPAAEPLGENDPLPFMRTEQNAQAEEPGSGGLLLKTLASMAFIVGLIFVGAWGAKKLGFGPARPASPELAAKLSVITSLSLGNGRTVSAVRFGERTLLIGSTPQSFTLLAEDDSETFTSPRSVAELLAEDEPAFSGHFDHALGRIRSMVKGNGLG